MSTLHSPLRLNVGFIVHSSIGFSREFEFDIPKINLSPDLELTDLRGIVRITRTPQGLPVQVKMEANLTTQCVRCLTDTQQPLSVDFTELYAFSPKQITDSGLILPDDMHIDLEPLLREYMLLEIPISTLCREDCRGLCPICGANLNETDCDHREEETDPRLSVLKSLLEEDKEENEGS